MRGYLLGGAMILCFACATVGSKAQEQQAGGAFQQPVPLSFSGFDKNQPIKPGFVLSIQVSTVAGPATEVSGVFTVDGSGAIPLKFVGRIEVGGLTHASASTKIAQALAAYIKEPKVIVATIAVPK